MCIYWITKVIELDCIVLDMFCFTIVNVALLLEVKDVIFETSILQEFYNRLIHTKTHLDFESTTPC